MGGDWAEVAFADAIDFQEGPGILAYDFRDSGVPLIRLAGLERGGQVLDGCNFLDPERVLQRWNHFRVQKGDVLLSTSASLGRTAIVDERGAGAVPYTGIIRMRPRLSDHLIAEFIPFLLESPHFQRQVDAMGVGSVIRHFGPSHLRQMTLILPPLDEQRAIAHILGTFDAKIELNRRMNETLEAMARSLFKSWFATRGSETAFRETIVSDLAAIGTLQVGDGYRAKNDEMASSGLPFARAGNIDGGFDFTKADLLGHAGVHKAGDKVSRTYDVVFTSKGTVGRFAFVDPNMAPFVYSPQLCFWRSTNHAALNPFVLFQWMRSRWFLEQVDRVKGQTDMADYVSLRDQRAMRFPLLEADAQKQIGLQLEAIQRLIWSNERQIRLLAEMRDVVLPRLLSGEISVTGANRALEAAV